MKLLIDIKKIKDAPVEATHFSDSENFTNLKNDLIYGNPSTYLISGYRGVGKTSFINALKKEVVSELKKLENDNNNNLVERKKIFINLNIGKYSSFANILRNIIREIYWGITNNEICKEILEEDPQLFVELKLIYDRTFENVEAKDIKIELEENFKSYVISSDFKQLVLRMLIILSGSVSLVNFIKNNDWKTYFFSIILCVIFILRYEYSIKRMDSKTMEINRTTFYDDEVAEFQLTRIIKELYKSGIELVFIIDELDKLEKEEDIIALISELKPLMLSGYSNYLLISGQKMLYRYLMADVLDDNVFSSIFSRNIHIPLLNRKGFEEYFSSLIGHSINDNDNYVIKQYLDSNILLSNRILRKFISLIRNDMRFDGNGNSYIEIKADNEILKTNAKISEILYDVEKEIRDKTNDNLEDGIRDFLISNLYIIIKNMKRIRPLSFEIENILKSKSFKDDEFASAYISYLKGNAQLIIDKMLEVNLLEVVDNEDTQEIDKNIDSTRYRWTENAVFNQQINQYGYLEEFIKFETWLRDISNQLVSNSIVRINQHSNFYALNGIFKTLINHGIISKELEEDFKYLQNIRNNIVHGHKLNKIEKEHLITFSNDLRKIKGITFEQIMISVLKEVNDNKLVNSNNHFYAVDAVINDVAFEFKYFKYKISLVQWIEKFTKQEFIKSLKELRIIILYEGNGNIEMEKREVRLILEKQNNIKIEIFREIELTTLIQYLKVSND
ncbi:P-loop NTPase fold protein [Rummeliibacillus sp. BSL5]